MPVITTKIIGRMKLDHRSKAQCLERTRSAMDICRRNGGRNAGNEGGYSRKTEFRETLCPGSASLLGHRPGISSDREPGLPTQPGGQTSPGRENGKRQARVHVCGCSRGKFQGASWDRKNSPEQGSSPGGSGPEGFAILQKTPFLPPPPTHIHLHLSHLTLRIIVLYPFSRSHRECKRRSVCTDLQTE